jgi:anti-sigma regulatory factor (Ser/Thr protein kinase)
MIEYRNELRIKISHQISTEGLKVYLDPVELRRIISNLINNSIEAMKDNSIEINVKVFKENNFIYITLKDNGTGIPNTVLSQIGQSEITTKYHGNGLGLFHAIESVKSWDGNLHIESQVSQGTVITISFENKFLAAQKTILLDDDELVRLTWTAKANKKNIDFQAIEDPSELLNGLNSLPLSTIFYIDSELRNGVKGEDVAQTLHSQGFTEIYMASGHGKEHFAHLNFIKGVHGKAPPWS